MTKNITPDRWLDEPTGFQLNLARRMLDRALSAEPATEKRRVLKTACAQIVAGLCRQTSIDIETVRSERKAYQFELNRTRSSSGGWRQVLCELIAKRSEEMAMLADISSEATFLLLQLPAEDAVPRCDAQMAA